MNLFYLIINILLILVLWSQEILSSEMPTKCFISLINQNFITHLTRWQNYGRGIDAETNTLLIKYMYMYLYEGLECYEATLVTSKHKQIYRGVAYPLYKGGQLIKHVCIFTYDSSSINTHINWAMNYAIQLKINLHCALNGDTSAYLFSMWFDDRSNFLRFRFLHGII